MAVFRVSDTLQKKPSKKRADFKAMMLTETPYELPTIRRSVNDDWFIQYYYRHPITLEKKRF